MTPSFSRSRQLAELLDRPGTLDRRGFIALSAVAAGGSLLAACGGDTNPGGAAASSSDDLAANTGTISLLTWETYHERPWVAAYQKRHGVKIEAQTIGSVDELFAKTQASGGVDLVIVDTGSLPRYVDAGLIRPIDAGKVQNASNITGGIDWQTLNRVGGDLYAVPYNWGTQPLMYDESVIPEAPTSWEALWDPKYKGKVVMFDDSYITMPMIALKAGARDPYNLTDAEFEACRQALEELRPQVVTVAKGFDDAANIYAAGDGVIGYCQNISIVYELQNRGKKFNYSFPGQGTPTWIDNATLGVDGHRQEVYDFIDEMLSLQWQGRFVDFSFNNGVLTAEDGREVVDPDVLTKTNIVDQQQPGFWDKMSLLEPPESVERRLELWNEFKAGI